MIEFAETGICLQYLGRLVLLLGNTSVNEVASCLKFQVQQLRNILLVGFSFGFVHLL